MLRIARTSESIPSSHVKSWSGSLIWIQVLFPSSWSRKLIEPRTAGIRLHMQGGFPKLSSTPNCVPGSNPGRKGYDCFVSESASLGQSMPQSGPDQSELELNPSNLDVSFNPRKAPRKKTSTHGWWRGYIIGYPNVPTWLLNGPCGCQQKISAVEVASPDSWFYLLWPGEKQYCIQMQCGHFRRSWIFPGNPHKKIYAIGVISSEVLACSPW